jgi:NitT/TauT family transport system substrate-binding protein
MTPNPAGGPMAQQRRRPTLTRLALSVTAGIALLLAAGCSSGGSGGTSPVAGTITIAAVPSVDDAPLWLAKERGLFAAAGLNVQINTVSSDAAAVAEVANGQAQIAASDYGNILAYQANPKNSGNLLYLLADGYDAGTGNVEILVRPPSSTNLHPITDPAQLTNQTIGIPDQLTIADHGAPASDSSPTPTVPKHFPSSLDAVAASAEMSDFLLDVSLVVHWQPMSEQQELTDLQNGTLKAVLLTQPYVYEAEADFGAIELTDVFSGQTANLPLSGYVAADSWAERNSQAVADFRSALDDAQTQAAMIGPVQQTLRTTLGISQADADMTSLGTYPTSISDLQISRVATLVQSAGVVTVNTGGFLSSLLDLPAAKS